MKRRMMTLLFLAWILQPGLATLHSEPIVYPNPFSPSKAVGGVLKFDGLSELDHIRIYTPDGILVRSLGPAAGGILRWDGRDSAGNIVYPGLYFYVIDGTEGVSKVGRLLVQN